MIVVNSMKTLTVNIVVFWAYIKLHKLVFLIDLKILPFSMINSSGDQCSHLNFLVIQSFVIFILPTVKMSWNFKIS